MRRSYKEMMDSFAKKELDIQHKTIPFMGGELSVLCIVQLVDRALLTENIMKPLVRHCSAVRAPVNAQKVLDGIIYADHCHLERDPREVERAIYAGMIVIIFSNDNSSIIVNLKKVEQRDVSQPQLEYTVRGPQDCFTENMNTNLSLVRYRIKDDKLRIEKLSVGVRTRTTVALLYIEDIANETMVREVRRRIGKINVDGISESGELQDLLLNHRLQIFPNMGLIERSDKACHSLLEGKVVVLVEGSGIALMAPKTFSEYFYSCDDRYDNKLFGLFSRLLRYAALLVALTGSSLFVAVTSFHTSVLPSDYAISLAQMRVNVPFSALTGAFILEFITELLREALIRIPRQIGPAIGIVGAIVIGQAAISAGIFSPLMLIIISMSLMASFAIPDYSLINSFRVLKIILLLLTGMLGFYGFTLFLTFILAEMASTDSFGVPFFSPWAPFNMRGTIRSFIQSSRDRKRPAFLHTKDDTRAGKPTTKP